MNLNIQNSRLNIKFRVLHSDSISSSNDEHIARFIFKIWRIGAHLWQDFFDNLDTTQGFKWSLSWNHNQLRNGQFKSQPMQCEHLGCENVDDGKRGESGG